MEIIPEVIETYIELKSSMRPCESVDVSKVKDVFMAVYEVPYESVETLFWETYMEAGLQALRYIKKWNQAYNQAGEKVK